MLRIAVLVAVLVWINGCSTKVEKDFKQRFEAEKSHHKSLMKTEMVRLVKNHTDKIIVRTTYLPNSKSGVERFVLGLHMDTLDESIASTPAASKIPFIVKLNGVAPIKVVQLSNEDTNVLKLPLTSKWMDYYRIDFPATKAQALYLKIKVPLYGEGKLYFAKRAKYTL